MRPRDDLTETDSYDLGVVCATEAEAQQLAEANPGVRYSAETPHGPNTYCFPASAIVPGTRAEMNRYLRHGPRDSSPRYATPNPGLFLEQVAEWRAPTRPHIRRRAHCGGRGGRPRARRATCSSSSSRGKPRSTSDEPPGEHAEGRAATYRFACLTPEQRGAEIWP